MSMESISRGCAALAMVGAFALLSACDAPLGSAEAIESTSAALVQAEQASGSSVITNNPQVLAAPGNFVLPGKVVSPDPVQTGNRTLDMDIDLLNDGAVPTQAVRDQMAQVKEGKVGQVAGKASTAFTVDPVLRSHLANEPAPQLSSTLPSSAPRLFTTEAWNVASVPGTVTAVASTPTQVAQKPFIASGTVKQVHFAATNAGSAGSTTQLVSPVQTIVAASAAKSSVFVGDIVSPEPPPVSRYSCCDDVPVYASATSNSTVKTRLKQNDWVWVTDLAGSSNLRTIMQQVNGCTNNASCLSAITQIASRTRLEVFAKVFVPDANLSGFVPLASLFVRPVGEEDNSATVEVGYRRIARALEQGIDSVFNPEGCEHEDVVTQVNASTKDLFWDRAQQKAQPCDDLMACPDYVFAKCNDRKPGDKGFDECTIKDVQECSMSEKERPSRKPSSDLGYCLLNRCPGKQTCPACRDWYQYTGMDSSGLLTNDELIDACIQRKRAETGDDDCNEPLFGGKADDPCRFACERDYPLWNQAMCGAYVTAGDRRAFADHEDYTCGEVPFGKTHPYLRYYEASDEWLGKPDSLWKEVQYFDLFGTGVSIEMGREPLQRATSLTGFDLTTRGSRKLSVPADLQARNVRLSLTPFLANLGQGNVPALWVRACGHLPGVRLDGPNVSFEPDETRGLLRGIDFGHLDVERTDVCAFGFVALDKKLKPKVEWVDAELDLVGIEYDDVDVKPGPLYHLAAAGALGASLGTAALAGIYTTETILAKVNQDGDAWFTDPLVMLYKGRVNKDILDQLNDMTSAQLASLNGDDLRARLNDLCQGLDPLVQPNHPYYWFYHFLRGQCTELASEGQIRPFLANKRNTGDGCYGFEQFFTPADAGKDVWWQEYIGQEWYFGYIPDKGCRTGNEVRSVLDPAVWDVLRCGVAIGNAWFNREQPANLLPQMLTQGCGQVGLNSLTDLYGDGRDLANMYLAKHGDGPAFKN